ncbi:hypothetical protein [Acetonema longum]|uniref:hypothetical protein n=1 Tax=Acetonema longum TaxID=2374 RepID=UPI0002FF74AC|nr:hypothetical protein [Acetonema longum]
MNRIKVLYDAVMAMRKKETFNGTLTVQVNKDDVRLFSLRNEFVKNLLTGQTKAKITTDLNYDGTTFNHESNTEFTRQPSGECRQHHFHNLHPHFQHFHEAGRHGGWQGRLARLAFGFSILSALQIEEQEGKPVIMLSAADLSEDARDLFREHLIRFGACRQHQRHGLFREICQADEPDFAARIFLNANHEIEKAVIIFAGTRQDEQNTAHDVTAKVELSLVG